MNVQPNLSTTTSPPLLSVITVTKNCVATLEKTLRSVQAIKTGEMEYIIVDCVSTDGTLELAKRYGELVDILQSERDKGIYNAMNKGVALARGDYVLFINGDDELIADGFASVTQALRKKAAEVVCATTVVGNADVPDETLVAIPWRLLFFNSVPHPSSFVARSLLLAHPFREDLHIASDYEFFLAAYKQKRRFLVLPAVTALHHRDGASANTQRSADESESIRREYLRWRYPLLNFLQNIYRSLKSVLRNSS
jgi:glycosyltransferase involved in cell wall biosynthesis